MTEVDDILRPRALPPSERSAPAFLAEHAADLARLAAKARRRDVALAAGRDFASNDYLGIGRSQRLALAISHAVDEGVPVGSGGSRLLRGHHAEHGALEAEAAAVFGSEASLFFGSGFAANTALFATLPQRGDLIVHDELIHASAHDGIRLSRAEAVAAGHNAPDRVASAIAAWRGRGGTGRPWIASESLYSMDGDRAPLADLMHIADRHDGILLVDEAHATGVFGRGGRGLAEELQGRPNVITLHTCGKALGTEGALVCGPAVVRDFLINRARGFVFSTAPSPLMAAATRESLRIMIDEPARRQTLHEHVALAERLLAPLGVAPTGSQILPLVIGDDARTMRIAAALQAAGFDVRGIRPPTVPAGTSRLRPSITCNVSTADIVALAGALGEVLR